MIQIGGLKTLPGMRISISRLSMKFDDCTIVKSGPYMFICHNGDIVDNSRSIKFGYKHSLYVSDIEYWRINSEKSKYEFKDNFSIFLSNPIINDMIQYKILELFQLKLGIFDNYNKILPSINKGNVVLSSSDSKYPEIEIKISRLLSKINQIISKDTKTFVYSLSLPQIEQFYDTYCQSQLQNNCELKILTGEDILKGYDRENYFISDNHSSLASSCMTSKLDYLDIYTKNSNISLAVLYFCNKIVARNLLFKATDNEIYFGHTYANKEYFVNIFNSKLKDIYPNIKNIEYSSETKYVQLENIEFPYYPYIDHFCFLHLKTKMLLTHSKDIRNNKLDYYYLKSQTGSWNYY